MRELRFLLPVLLSIPLLASGCGKRGNLFLPPKPAPAQTTPPPAAKPPAATHERLPENSR